MRYVLTVTRAFGEYAAGQRIVDPAEIHEIEAGGNAAQVVRSALTDDDKAARHAQIEADKADGPGEPAATIEPPAPAARSKP